MRVAVAGGTGVSGREVVAALEAAGHEAVPLSRSGGVDLISGTGLDAALEGVDAVVDASNVETMSRAVATEFFTTATRTLLAAEERAGVRHHVLLSIVGIDRVHNGYYQGKLAQEAVVRSGAVPWTVLRVTQFHEFAAQSLDRMAAGPIVLAPRMRSQPVAVREVGVALAALAVGEPAGMAPELAGPRVELMSDLMAKLKKATGRSGLLLPVPVPGRMGSGGLLPLGDGPRGVETFDEWLVRTASLTLP